MSNSHDSEDQVEVLHVGKYFPPDLGGMETYLRDLMMSSLKQGTRSAALCSQRATTMRSTDENFSAEEIYSPLRGRRPGSKCFTPISQVSRGYSSD